MVKFMTFEIKSQRIESNNTNILVEFDSLDKLVNFLKSKEKDVLKK